MASDCDSVEISPIVHIAPGLASSMCRFELLGVIILIFHDIRDAIKRKRARKLHIQEPGTVQSSVNLL